MGGKFIVGIHPLRGILVEKEVSHYWKYGYQQYNAYSFYL
jgi:hypothetical protein